MRSQKKGGDRIGTCINATNHLLKTYVTIANIAKAISKRGQLVNLTNESVVHVADAVGLKAVRGSTAYPHVRIKKVFGYALPHFTRDGVWAVWGRKLKVHVTKLAQYVHTLLVQQHNLVEELQIQSGTFSARERLHCRAAVVASGEADDSTINN